MQIEGCLRSLEPADPIVLIDSGSRDATLALARQACPRIEVLEREFSTFADQRNFGLARFAPSDWVLHLDADERLTSELAAELAALEPPADAVAYNLASRTFLAGRQVLRASGFPVYQTRLTRGSFRFEQVGHGQKAPAVLGTLPVLKAPYDHHPFEKGFDHWRARHERYAAAEAQILRMVGTGPSLRAIWNDPIARRQWLSHRVSGSALRPMLAWLYLMVVRRGLLDGRPGWEYGRRRWLYERMVVRQLRGPAPPA